MSGGPEYALFSLENRRMNGVNSSLFQSTRWQLFNDDFHIIKQPMRIRCWPTLPGKNLGEVVKQSLQFCREPLQGCVLFFCRSEEPPHPLVLTQDKCSTEASLPTSWSLQSHYIPVNLTFSSVPMATALLQPHISPPWIPAFRISPLKFVLHFPAKLIFSFLKK